MFYNSSSVTDPKTTSARASTFEVLVFCVGETWLAVRANRIQRLMAYTNEAIKPPTAHDPAFPALLGFFEPSSILDKKEGDLTSPQSGKFLVSLERFPVLALNTLLELSAPVGETSYKQIICFEHNGGTVGFAIETALEIERANVTDVRVLPAWVEKSRHKPVVWALWQRTDDDLLPLVDPLEAIS
jgi:chemotaxis signal transduction protein